MPQPAQTARRKRRWIALAATLPVIAIALPALRSTEPRTLSPRKAEHILEQIWDAFAASETPSTTDLIAFETWLEEDAGADARLRMAPVEQWSVERTNDRVALRLGLEHAAPPGADAPSLVVRVQPWAGARYALAAEDLSCVLCHTRVVGDVFSRSAHSSSPDEAIDIEGERIHGSVEPLFHSSSRGTSGDNGVDFAAVVRSGGTLHGLPKRAGEGAVEVTGAGDEPFSIHGDVTLEGDVVLHGRFVGEGRLFVDGDVYVPRDLRSNGDGRLVVVASGSVLVGDVLRPRSGESVAVTGDASGSFSFTIETLARWNGWRVMNDLAPLTLFPDQAAWMLDGSHVTGDWFDPSLERAPGVVESVLGSRALATRFPRSFQSDHLTVEATIVARGALIAVAPSNRPFGPAGSISFGGALVATHAAIHAPSGLEILDDPQARRGLAAAGEGGLVATIQSPARHAE